MSAPVSVGKYHSNFRGTENVIVMNSSNQRMRRVFVAVIFTGGLAANTLPIGGGRAAAQTVNATAAIGPAGAKDIKDGRPLYLYTLASDGTPAAYDEALAAASLQGIINRKSPEVYLLSRKNRRPQFWLDLLTQRQPLAPRTPEPTADGHRRAGETRRGRA